MNDWQWWNIWPIHDMNIHSRLTPSYYFHWVYVKCQIFPLLFFSPSLPSWIHITDKIHLLTNQSNWQWEIRWRYIDYEWQQSIIHLQWWIPTPFNVTQRIFIVTSTTANARQWTRHCSTSYLHNDFPSLNAGTKYSIKANGNETHNH